MPNSREKGKRGELELSRLLRDYGYDTRRGQQYCGSNGDADVVGLPGIHIEETGKNGWLPCLLRAGSSYTGRRWQMQKFNLELTIDEIVLIKECLFHFTEWKADTADRYRTRMHAFEFLTQKQIESLKALSDKLSPYGYGM